MAGAGALWIPGFYTLDNVAFACTGDHFASICQQNCRDYLNITVVPAATGSNIATTVFGVFVNTTYLPQCHDFYCDQWVSTKAADKTATFEYHASSNETKGVGVVTFISPPAGSNAAGPNITLLSIYENFNCSWNMVFNSSTTPPTTTHLQQIGHIDYTGYYNASLPVCRTPDSGSQSTLYQPDSCDTLQKWNVTIQDYNGLLNISQWPPSLDQFNANNAQGAYLRNFSSTNNNKPGSCRTLSYAVADYPFSFETAHTFTDPATNVTAPVAYFQYSLDPKKAAFAIRRVYPAQANSPSVTCEWNMTRVSTETYNPATKYFLPDPALGPQQLAPNPSQTSTMTQGTPGLNSQSASGGGGVLGLAAVIGIAAGGGVFLIAVACAVGYIISQQRKKQKDRDERLRQYELNRVGRPTEPEFHLDPSAATNPFMKFNAEGGYGVGGESSGGGAPTSVDAGMTPSLAATLAFATNSSQFNTPSDAPMAPPYSQTMYNEQTRSHSMPANQRPQQHANTSSYVGANAFVDSYIANDDADNQQQPARRGASLVHLEATNNGYVHTPGRPFGAEGIAARNSHLGSSNDSSSPSRSPQSQGGLVAPPRRTVPPANNNNNLMSPPVSSTAAARSPSPWRGGDDDEDPELTAAQIAASNLDYDNRHLWTVEDVGVWARAVGISASGVGALKQNRIDGATLPHLDEERVLKQGFGMGVSDRLAFVDAIRGLERQARGTGGRLPEYY